MPVYVICRVFRPDAMNAAVQRVFPHDHMQLHDNEWLVFSAGTAVDVSEQLHVTVGHKVPTTDDVGPAMILAVSGYFGRAETSIWDWIKAKMERGGG
jgi:hypothetical protein